MAGEIPKDHVKDLTMDLKYFYWIAPIFISIYSSPPILLTELHK